MKVPLIVISFLILGCSSTEKLKRSGEYQKIIDRYALNFKKNSPEVNYLVGEAYRKSNRIELALIFYQKVMEQGFSDELFHLRYAEALEANEQYEEAKTILRKGIRSIADSTIKETLKKELASIQRATVPDLENSFYEVSNFSQSNTNFDEYSPVYKGGYLYFVSNRDDGKIYQTTGTPFTDIFRVRCDLNTISGPIQKMDSEINLKGVNEGTVSLSQDGKFMVFARANSGNPNGYSNVNLFYTRFRNGSWTTPRPIEVSDPRAWDSTPYLSPDGKTLYFSSDRAGGYGQSDLYTAKLDRRGRWVDARNLGPDINTSGHDQFPFVSEDGTLYFSSDGHYGLGKLDIFKVEHVAGQIFVKNLGKPVNSNADDFGFFEYDPAHGFFSSNRAGGKGGDDIYTFANNDPNLKIVNYFLAGTVYSNDPDSGQVVLAKSDVKLLDKNNSVLDEVFTDDDGRFRFRVYPEEVYQLLGEKENFFATRTDYSTIGKTVDKTTLTDFQTNVEFEADIFLDKIVIDKPIVLNDIYYDLDMANIRPDAEKVLDSLVMIMNDNPDISIELSSHTDSRADDEYNMDLSVRRARAAAVYLVINGIDRSRVFFKGYGESKLLIRDAATEEEHQINRRTEFKVLKYDPQKLDEEDDYDRFFKDQGE